MSYSEDYRPVNIDFDVANSSPVVPDCLGSFENLDAVNKFLAEHFTAISTPLKANRYMDNHEKSEVRKTASQIMEDELPVVKKQLAKATYDFDRAKEDLNTAKEYLTATVNKAENLFATAKKGIKEMSLDDISTWRLPYNGVYYYFTFVDGMLKLCKIADIPEYEKRDLYNAMSRNDDYFNPKPASIEETVSDDLLEGKPFNVDAKTGEIMDEIIGFAEGKPFTVPFTVVKGPDHQPPKRSHHKKKGKEENMKK